MFSFLKGLIAPASSKPRPKDRFDNARKASPQPTNAPLGKQKPKPFGKRGDDAP